MLCLCFSLSKMPVWMAIPVFQLSENIWLRRLEWTENCACVCTRICIYYAHAYVDMYMNIHQDYAIIVGLHADSFKSFP